ncbi:MAG: single-stranded DNA-binding protein [Spirochaetales bacterium]|nr:single-stranded DNA-binding protein [Spirochaetales bacterium]
MADLSVAVLVGRLTRDAELKYTNSGQAVCHFSVATSTRRKKGDQWVDEASFWDVDLWGKQGESINQYLTKGKLVAVEGTMRQDRWEQDGQPRIKVIVNANTVQLLGSGQGGSQQGGYQAGGREGAQGDGRGGDSRPAAPAQRTAQPDEFSDDIPF